MRTKSIYVFTSVIALLFCLTSCKGQGEKKETSGVSVATTVSPDTNAKRPVMSFEKKEHDFGTIVAGTPQETVFEFTNTGDAPLIISNARSSCGCTVPDYPQNTPIAPGDKGELVVKFNGAGANLVTKTITLTTNTAAGTEMLRIKAFIEPRGSGAFDVPMKKK